MSDKNVFSREGFEYYSRKLTGSTGKIRKLGQAVGDAAGLNCDWHDNFEFDDALRNLERGSKRSADLQAALSGAQIIDVIEQETRIAIGNTVEIEFDDEEQAREITIGAWGESDPLNGLISYEAPLARAVIGKFEGEEGKLGPTDKARQFMINRIHPASYKYRSLIKELFEKGMAQVD